MPWHQFINILLCKSCTIVTVHLCFNVFSKIMFATSKTLLKNNILTYHCLQSLKEKMSWPPRGSRASWPPTFPSTSPLFPVWGSRTSWSERKVASSVQRSSHKSRPSSHRGRWTRRSELDYRWGQIPHDFWAVLESGIDRMNLHQQVHQYNHLLSTY